MRIFIRIANWEALEDVAKLCGADDAGDFCREFGVDWLNMDGKWFDVDDTMTSGMIVRDYINSPRIRTRSVELKSFRIEAGRLYWITVRAMQIGVNVALVSETEYARKFEQLNGQY